MMSKSFSKEWMATRAGVRYVIVCMADTRSGSGTVDFQEFVGALSAFSSKGGREEKMRCKSRPEGRPRGC